MTTCPNCHKPEADHCQKCMACSPVHVCQSRRSEPFSIVHASSGVDVIGDRG